MSVLVDTNASGNALADWVVGGWLWAFNCSTCDGLMAVLVATVIEGVVVVVVVESLVAVVVAARPVVVGMAVLAAVG